jgi:ABC-type multidrug transport system permease subunit
MRSILRMAVNDVRLTARDRASFFFLLILPVAMMAFFGAMGGGSPSSEPPRFTLHVVDLDVGWLSRALVGELEGGAANFTELTPAAWRQPGERVRTLVIPEGFTRKAMAGEQQVVELQKDAGADESFSLAAQVHITRAIVRTVARLAEMQSGSVGDTPREDEAALTEFRALAERPPLVTLEAATAGAGTPVPQGLAQSVPGILTMTVLMMTLIYGAVFLTNEKRTGMLRRQSTLPVGRGEIFLGKLTGRLFLVFVQLAVLLPAGRYLFGVHWGSSPAGLLLLLASYALAVAGLSTFLGAVARTTEQASSIGWIASMVLAALGGCWWPAEVMPSWLRTVGHAFPTAWAMDGFHALVSFGRGAEAIVTPAAVLVGFGLLFAGLGARFLRYE